MGKLWFSPHCTTYAITNGRLGTLHMNLTLFYKDLYDVPPVLLVYKHCLSGQLNMDYCFLLARCDTIKGPNGMPTKLNEVCQNPTFFIILTITEILLSCLTWLRSKMILV